MQADKFSALYLLPVSADMGTVEQPAKSKEPDAYSSAKTANLGVADFNAAVTAALICQGMQKKEQDKQFATWQWQTNMALKAAFIANKLAWLKPLKQQCVALAS